MGGGFSSTVETANASANESSVSSSKVSQSSISSFKSSSSVVNSSVSSTAVSSANSSSSNVNELANTDGSSTQPASGKIGETTITTVPSSTTGAVLPHFQTGNGDIAYCYNWKLEAPDQVNQMFNQYKFYDGLQSVTGDQTTVDEVAAAIEAGYHKDANSGSYNIAPQFQSLAQQSFNGFVKQVKQATADADVNHTDNPFAYIDISNYTLANFEQDVTQSVIWAIGGGPNNVNAHGSSWLANNTALGQAILAYAKAHPLDEQTAYPKNVALNNGNGSINSSNPLKMDPNTKLSQPFTLTGFNGSVQVTGLPQGYEVVDNNGNPVSQVESGKTYKIKYTGSDTPSTATGVANKIAANVNYEALKDSNYFSAQLTTDPNTNNPYQNLVNLSTTLDSLSAPIIWQAFSSSSSSSNSSSNSSSSSSSSSISSSSLVSSSSSSSSAVSSSKNSSSTV